MCIYRLLIMFAHCVGWALVWTIGGPRPLVSTIGGFGFIECLKVVDINRLLPLVVCVAHMLS